MDARHPPAGDRLLELALEARHRALSADESLALATFAAEQPEAHRELMETLAAIEPFRGARIRAGAGFRARLDGAIAGWVREDRKLSGPARASPSDHPLLRPVARVVRFLSSRDERPGAPSWPTVLLGRSLAAYVGVAATLCVHFALQPDPAVEHREFRVPERAVVEAPPAADSRPAVPADGR